uniref:Helicase-associated domain-containing protein n=1 Tax=Globisporangium ultimum (strain ATCC 200006 / CBS 805.95 / DAOM BR144) TaxID=431595 RepID=K3WY59_GLOUD
MLALVHGRRVNCAVLLYSHATSSVVSCVSSASAIRAFSDAHFQQQQRAAKRGKKHEEIAALVAAVRIFHDKHQHFVVPYNFEIPVPLTAGSGSVNGELWPKHLQGLKLGRQMRRLVKTLNGKSGAIQHGNALQELRQMGFPVVANWEQFRWEQVALHALQTFQTLEGHLRIPRRFVVPEDDERWPKASWGFKLGAHVNQLRVNRATLQEYQLDALDKISFPWCVMDDMWDNQFLPALSIFRDLHGHVNVPQRFVVPSNNDKWPHTLSGFRLGRVVSRVRSADGFCVNQVKRSTHDLEALGFSYNSNEPKWNEKILPSLQTFYAVYDHCNVDQYFVVPSQAPWPEQAWGLKLGFIVRNIRQRGDFFELVGRDMEQLEQLDFVWNAAEAKWRQRILPSLRTFVAVYGHSNIDRNFVVPSEPPWPVKAWGTKLGKVATDVHTQFHATTDAAAKPRSTSPRSVHHQRREFGKLEAALRAFQRIHGHYAVPLRFTIPGLKEEEEQQVNVWPEELRGMKLGTALSRFVKVADKPENVAIASKLEDMGVPVQSISDWKTYLWTNVSVASLHTFYTIHGHFLIPYAFTVPQGDAAWPRQTWGFKLGYWVIELRRDKSKLEVYQLQDLAAMKFVWNAREARWNQYFVPAMKKYTELYGKSSVPQSFVVPHDDVRWPKELHGYRLGQKVNNLRCGKQSANTLDETVAWNDVELVYSNWVLLDILHDNTKENGSRSSDASGQDA